jgi:hypothetical protein
VKFKGKKLNLIKLKRIKLVFLFMLSQKKQFSAHHFNNICFNIFFKALSTFKEKFISETNALIVAKLLRETW